MRGGVNTSSNATFGPDRKEPKMMFLLRRIKNIILCHSELGSESHDLETLKRVQGDISIRHTFKKAFAFTLAETLIVMGIIGVVAALTIPNLNSSTGEKEKIAKVKKIYQNLDDALSRAHAVYGPQEEWYSGKTEAERYKIFFERVTEFMKVQKTCAPNTTGCMTKNQGNSLNIGSVTDTLQKYYQAILADGSSVSFFPYDDACSENYCSTLYVDIDGPSKGSFTYGKDLFTFVGTQKEGLYQAWALDSTQMEKCFKWGNTCSAWVMQTDNMDYLKAGSDGKCKSNTSLTLNMFANPAVTSCK